MGLADVDSCCSWRGNESFGGPRRFLGSGTLRREGIYRAPSLVAALARIVPTRTQKRRKSLLIWPGRGLQYKRAKSGSFVPSFNTALCIHYLHF